MTLSTVTRSPYLRLQMNDFELLFNCEGEIVQAVYCGMVIKLGLAVVHVGSCSAIPKDSKGKIEKLSRPYHENHTTNIVNVIFQGSPLMWKMRPEEIQIL